MKMEQSTDEVGMLLSPHGGRLNSGKNHRLKKKKQSAQNVENIIMSLYTQVLNIVF